MKGIIIPRHPMATNGRARLGRWPALFLVVAASGAMAATSAGTASASPGAGSISFYGDIGNMVGGQNPLLVRPRTVQLTEDGSVALVDLHWTGWGASVARATGSWRASNCTPSCADGRLTTRPARLKLSSPGIVDGRRVYRCFEVTPPHPGRDIEDDACIRPEGGSYYGYQTVSGR